MHTANAVSGDSALPPPPTRLQIPLSGAPGASKVAIEVRTQADLLGDLRRGSTAAHTADVLVIAIPQAPRSNDEAANDKQPGNPGVSNEEQAAVSLHSEVDRALLNGALERAAKKAKFTGAEGKTLVLHALAADTQFERLALLGLGNWNTGLGDHSILHRFDSASGENAPSNEANKGQLAAPTMGSKLTPFAASKAGKSLAGIISSSKATKAAVCFSSNHMDPSAFKVFVESTLFYCMSDKRFKGQLGNSNSGSGNSNSGQQLRSLTFFIQENGATGFEEVLKEAKHTAVGMQLTRELVNTPANYCNPESLAEVARQIADSGGLECVILDQQQCKQRGMGAYLAVNQGSMYEPQFIHLVYKPSAASGPIAKSIAIIGKGICMDTGGYNLKTDTSINTMKFDMAGAAAVLGAAQVIGAIKPPGVEVHFVVPAAENMISQYAYRPGDVVTAANGITIEVGNTDAEGRLTLADALVYAEREIRPDLMIDCATLTGAIMVGLGTGVAGVYGSDNLWMRNVLQAARISGTPVWPMPLYTDYEQLFESKIADLSNLPSARYGGSITAALFLKNFVKATPWCHVDLAGPVWDSNAKEATGYGVQMLVEAVRLASSP